MNSKRNSRLIKAMTLVLGVMAVNGIAVTNALATPAQSSTITVIEQNRVPRIQVALLLDTSNSMDGLIDQAKSQLWEVVNEFTRARYQGQKPVLEVAVYQYGNSALSANSGYIRQMSQLTGDLDLISEKLFSLQTDGGEEYCGSVIRAAVRDLEWGSSPHDVRAIFIAGNEGFSQGPVDYRKALGEARQLGVEVNTIYAGSAAAGEQEGWVEAARIAGGAFASIDHNHKVVHIPAPQDQQIEALNAQLNDTYLPYGDAGASGKQRQLEQDSLSRKKSLSYMATRTQSKASSAYNNQAWDLVDAVETGAVDLAAAPATALPEEMQAMDNEERRRYVAESQKQRREIQAEIARLSRERETFIASERRARAGSETSTLDTAMVQSVKKQAEQKDYEFVAQ